MRLPSLVGDGRREPTPLSRNPQPYRLAVDRGQFRDFRQSFLQRRDLVQLERVPLTESRLERKLSHRVHVVGLDGREHHVVVHRHVRRQKFDAQLLSQLGYLARALRGEFPNRLVRDGQRSGGCCPTIRYCTELLLCEREARPYSPWNRLCRSASDDLLDACWA